MCMRVVKQWIVRNDYFTCGSMGNASGGDGGLKGLDEAV